METSCPILLFIFIGSDDKPNPTNLPLYPYFSAMINFTSHLCNRMSDNNPAEHVLKLKTGVENRTSSQRPED